MLSNLYRLTFNTMAKKFTGIRGLSGEVVIPVQYDVASGTASSITPGMLVTFEANSTVSESANGAIKTADICGIAASESTETAAAAGTVLVYRASVLLANAVATTPANLSAARLNTKVTLDVSGEDHTVDEDDTTNGFIRIRSYDNTTDGNVVVEIPTSACLAY